MCIWRGFFLLFVRLLLDDYRNQHMWESSYTMTSYRVFVNIFCRYRRGCLLWWPSRNRAVPTKFDGLLHTNDHCRINMPILRDMEVDDMNLPCTSDFGFVVLIPAVLLTKWGRCCLQWSALFTERTSGWRSGTQVMRWRLIDMTSSYGARVIKSTHLRV